MRPQHSNSTAGAPNGKSRLSTGQSDFSLIELIVVIVILGILSTTALPKFASLNSDARIAVVKGAKGALSSAAAMVTGKHLVASPPSASVTYGGATITFATVFASGYPRADAGLAAASGLTIADFTIIAASSAAGAVSGLSCFVKYTEPVSAIVAPNIAVTSSSC